VPADVARPWFGENAEIRALNRASIEFDDDTAPLLDDARRIPPAVDNAARIRDHSDIGPVTPTR
jgi:hypothetical protein